MSQDEEDPWNEEGDIPWIALGPGRDDKARRRPTMAHPRQRKIKKKRKRNASHR